METRFKVGDRVRHEERGEGDVVHIEVGEQPFGVCFDGMAYGHDCHGHCTEGKGWYCYEYELTLIPSAQPAPPTHPDRAMIAAMAMQGILSSSLGKDNKDAAISVAKASVMYADALIAELQKTKQ
jgi:hypothetical protein